MDDPRQQPPQEPARRPSRFQFSLRALFWLTAGVAVLCSVVFAMPNWAAVPAMLLATLALPGVSVVLLTHGGPSQRAFAMGAIFPACAIFVIGAACLLSVFSFSGGLSGALVDEDSANPIRILFLAGLLTTMLCGLLSLGVDRAIGRGRGKKRW
jgi:hypothetical protein